MLYVKQMWVVLYDMWVILYKTCVGYNIYKTSMGYIIQCILHMWVTLYKTYVGDAIYINVFVNYMSSVVF